MAVKAVQQFMLGTVMNNEAQARDTMSKMKAAGYDGIELCGFMLHPSSLMVRLMTKAAGMPVGRGGRLPWPRLVKDSGLKVVSLHCDLGSVERSPAAVAGEALSFGTDKIVITGMYRFPYGEAEAVKVAPRHQRRSRGRSWPTEAIRASKTAARVSRGAMTR